MKLPRRILIVIAMVLPHLLAAQYNAVLLKVPESAVASMNSNMHSGSDFLSNKDFFRLRQGGYLDQATISLLDDKLMNQNTIGGYYDFGMMNLSPVKRGGSRTDTLFMVSCIGYHQIQEAKFSREAGELLLHGNLMFEGMTVQLAPLRYQMQKYHQWKLGLMRMSENDKGVFYAGFTAGLNLGLQQMNIFIDKALLYTAPFGEYLTLDSRILFSRSEPEPFSITGVNGIGPTLDFFYAWIPAGNGPAVAVSFTQLGFIMWDKNSYSYQRDTIMLFEGLVIDNLFSADNLWNGTHNTDTLDRLFHRVGAQHRHYSSLPITFNMSLRQDLRGTPLALRTTFTYRHQTIMKPMLELALEWSAGKRTDISRSLFLGGYNGVSGGWSVQYTTRHAFKILLGSHDLYQTLGKETKVSLHLFAGISYHPSYVKI